MKLTVTIFFLATRAFADPGDRIDQCHLDNDGALRCSTANRLANAAMKAVVDRLRGYDRDQRLADVTVIVRHWREGQRGECREDNFWVWQITDAYSFPGISPGLKIQWLEGCAKTFATWLFKKENHGWKPGWPAYVNTNIQIDRADMKGVPKKCAAQVEYLVSADQEWLAAAKAAPDEDWSGDYAGRKNSVRALSECIEGE